MFSPASFFKSLKRYGAAEYGGMAVWAALGTPVLIGTAALSIDAARMYSLDQELQAAADAMARAGAAELDHRSDAISRADRAITNLVSNTQKHGKNGFGNVKAGSVRYLKTLPGNDFEAITANMLTTNPREAKYVEVTVVPETTGMMFPQGLVKNITSVTLQAKASAGSEQGVCGVAPIFICNPYEGSNTSIYDAMETKSFQRRQFLFKTPHRTCEPYGPGNFGYLDPFDGKGGASAIADAIAVDVPPVCMSKANGVTLRPGNISSMRKALNVRFDIYEGNFKRKRTDPAYAPAANVTKGYSGRTCRERPSWSAMGLPNDECFYYGTCSGPGRRMGDGNWDFVSYMEVNHNSMERITIDDVNYRIDYYNRTVTPSELPSRYDMYRWEIDNNCVPGRLTYGNNASTPEEGLPTCHATGPSEADVDRRIIYAAVMNCTEVEDKYGMNGRKSGLPVETFVKVFLTEPMGRGRDNQIWGEIVGPVVEGQDSVAVDKVAVAR